MPARTHLSAIVGTGAIANAHASALRAAGDRARLVAVVDIEHDRARAFADEHGVPRVYPSLAALLAREAVDLVHLCTPPRQHTPLAIECLDAGVTVLVEKPPALSLAEMDELVAAERRSSAHVATVFQHRFGAPAVRLRRLAAAARLGRPLLATCATLWYRDDGYFAVPWWGSWDSEGGGPTMGHGIHQFDLLLSVLGPWREVRALAARRARAVHTEDVSMALVTFESGAVATVVNSLVSPRQTSALRFDFERATVEVEHLYGYTETDWTMTPAPGHEDVLSWWADAGPSSPSSHEGQVTAVLDALDRGDPPPVTGADARNTMEFIAALYASAFTGLPVRCGQIAPGDPFYRRMDGTGAPWAAVAAP
ncbi:MULTISPECIES: Gfo/Idh/MocA family protein [Amycolatopsis]|uniref:Oxidoreductase n=1 Tax=Amycolatopsis bullii TaxID=941987 RepID=A0ABQ3KJP7_9PSEU|nr:Gfo/Idh/MocA family oxidoreductase [Amycolatopsis bullii]GHG14602.1 oxidoreductase [Amycolatopsis bullii]